jgi:hypothetical protein
MPLKCEKMTLWETVRCTASSGETFIVSCPSDTRPLVMADELWGNNYRFACGTPFFTPKTTFDWLYDHGDALAPFGAFLLGMLLAVVLVQALKWKVVRR